MRTFKDKTGREWTLDVNVSAVKRVRDLLKEDLLDVENVVPRLLLDPILLVDVIYCLCKPEADERQVTDEQFGRSMAGETIARAKEALLEDLADFFPDRVTQEAVRALPRKHDEIAAIQLDMLPGRLEQITAMQIKLLQQHLAKLDLPREIEAALATAGDSSTSSPASPE